VSRHCGKAEQGTIAEPTADLLPLQTSLEPDFFGAGGAAMRAAGVELTVELNEHAVWD
jgi:hypothetical protein